MQLPEALLQSLNGLKGFDKENFTRAHQSGEQVTSIRLNPAKPVNQFSILNFQFPIPWCRNGYYLPERPSFTLDPLFHTGAYYVQEASSMFLETAIQQTVDLSQPLKVLDLCAAPGGKSTLIQSLLNKDSFLVSNEVIKSRVSILAENITKWGAANVVVTNNDPKDFQRLENYFDVIVVDAPCSGSGLFRKDPDAVNEWSENNVQLCSQRQQRILADVLPALKDGGVLIYSTCSYSAAEDENITDWLTGEYGLQSLSLQTETGWGIVETISPGQQAPSYRFYPDKIKGEGFFIAAFKKEGHVMYQAMQGKHHKQTAKATTAEINVVKPYLQESDGFSFIKQEDTVLALPFCVAEELLVLKSALYIKKAGITLGKVIREELVPDHELALSTFLHPSIPVIDLDETTALQYLRRQDIRPPTSVKGWALAAYRDLPLGWVKILPNRINNYYPAAWRIVNK
ncbi:MAG: RNA methyltransferase [Ferruginibacter sp.]